MASRSLSLERPILLILACKLFIHRRDNEEEATSCWALEEAEEEVEEKGAFLAWERDQKTTDSFGSLLWSVEGGRDAKAEETGWLFWRARRLARLR